MKESLKWNIEAGPDATQLAMRPYWWQIEHREFLAEDLSTIAKIFTHQELRCYTADKDFIIWYNMAFEKQGVNSNCKDNRIM